MPDITFTSVGSRQKRSLDIGDATFAEVTALPITLLVAWLPSTSFNARVYADVEVQLIGTPRMPYVFQDSFDEVSYNERLAINRNSAALASLTVPGRCRLPGNCFLIARQGAGSSFYIRAGS